MINPNTIAEDNVKKYKHPPTWEQIDSFVKEVGVSIYHFELYYGISVNHLAKVRCGQRQLSKYYWHIFYLREIPTYGVGITGNYPRKTLPKDVPKIIPKRIPQLSPIHIKQGSDTHHRLTTVK